MSETKSVECDQTVAEVRKACRQFAMLYFHFSKVLVEEFGPDKAKELINKAIFELALDRTDQIRVRAKEQGLEFSPENFKRLSDLPFSGWVIELGRNHCPYAETWTKYYEQYPWFRELAPFYCDVIDTTNIENFTRKLSHKITGNVLNGDATCERIYFPSEDVKGGKFTYGRFQERGPQYEKARGNRSDGLRKTD